LIFFNLEYSLPDFLYSVYIEGLKQISFIKRISKRMLNKNRLTYLFQQYLNNNITDSELEDLFKYIKSNEEEEALEKSVVDVYQETQADEIEKQIDWNLMFDRIVRDAVEEKEIYIKRFPIWRSMVAAIVLLIIGAGAYFYINKENTPQEVAKHEEKKQDIMPGGNKAMLTLANGTTVILDSTQKGKLSGQENMRIVKLGSGKLAYQRGILKTEDGKHMAKSAMKYNTLTTPRGGQYQLTLSDGTRVWLNAGSSIRYPVVFNGEERRVEMTGEAYFEVAKNVESAFIVKKGDVKIKVLGTHFNVNAYADEREMKVTLLEGVVKVKNEILRPNEQAVLKDDKMRVLKDVNVGDIVAWKNGFFAFNNATLAKVMRKLSRWYDIEVVYKKGIDRGQRFSGKIGRNLTLSQVLNGLKQTRAHFKIEEDSRTVILQ